MPHAVPMLLASSSLAAFTASNVSGGRASTITKAFLVSSVSFVFSDSLQFHFAHTTSSPETYTISSFGVDPTKFKCSSEAIARRAIKGDSIPHINKLVDSYDYISLKYHTPCGGEDIDKMKGDILLKYSEGSEKYTQLGSKEETKVSKGEIVYVSGDEVVCAKWNWRE